MVDIVVCDVGIAILEDATASRLAALLFVLPLARDATVLVVDVIVLDVVSFVAVVALAATAAAAAAVATAVAAAAALAAVRRLVVVVIILEVALDLLPRVLGILGTFFPGVLAGAMHLAIALV